MTERTGVTEAILTTLTTWRVHGHIRGIDAALGRTIAELHPETDPVVPLLAAITSRHTADGHVALELRDLQGPGSDDQSPLNWLTAVPLSELTTRLKDHRETAPAGTSPLVFTDGPIPRVYLRRLFCAQEQLRECIAARLAPGTETIDPERIRRHGDILFPQRQPRADWQRIAAALAPLRPLTIITGGPGTGKTTTVLRLLALAGALARDYGDKHPLRIALAAPTGKAAIRMEEAIRLGVELLPPEYRQGIPGDVSTVHRLLGISPRSGGGRYNSENVLPLDLVVVDEASMINLELMTKLFQALPTTARIVLLGDRDQLAAVESGAVLSDLCRTSDSGGYRDETVRLVESLTGETIPEELRDSTGSDLAQGIIVLRESFRFQRTSKIALLAAAIRDGESERVAQVLDDPGGMNGETSEVRVVAAPKEPHAVVRRAALQGYAHYLAAIRDGEQPDPARCYHAFASFRILSPMRRGPWGTETINREMEAHLPGAGSSWYHGRPVSVTRNDYPTGLMNGDTGITLATDDRLTVYFPDGASGLMKGYPVTTLPPVETAFCLTVHKSQGSEFDDLLLVIPDQPSPVITRELLYTAVTRARNGVTIVEGSREVLLSGVRNPFRRGSALSEGWSG